METFQVWFHTTAINQLEINGVNTLFWFSCAYKSYVYTILGSIKSAIALCLKTDIHTLIKNYFIAKNANYRLSLQCLVIFLLVEGLNCCENYQTVTRSEQMLLEKKALIDSFAAGSPQTFNL